MYYLERYCASKSLYVYLLHTQIVLDVHCLIIRNQKMKEKMKTKLRRRKKRIKRSIKNF